MVYKAKMFLLCAFVGNKLVLNEKKILFITGCFVLLYLPVWEQSTDYELSKDCQ